MPKVENFWTKLARPIKVLAPMAGYTDSAFRLLCKDFGADIVITELVSADAVAYSKLKVESIKYKVDGKILGFNKVTSSKNKNTAELLSFFEAERPIVVQLFGKYPEKFGLAAKWITENLKPDGIDINMGCPARKVVGSDHGAALLKNPDLAVEIVKAVKKNTDLPVSVKTRLGWENDNEILEFAPKLVEAGIDAIIIHGRTYRDGFKGSARWDNIYKVKEMFGDKLTVIGNGDVTAISNSKFLISNQIAKFQIPNSKFSLDGVAIGRATFGKPFIFREAENQYKVESLKYKALLRKLILRHAELVSGSKGEYGIVEFRKHLLAYLRGFPEAKKLRLEAVKITSLADVKHITSNL